ncbi:conserved hypothetical protein [Vibrio chagasii]|nr:conserved hypothetical protein [Vibrio chagasii]CAH7002079.1 conserved hypothetical protein [Vibrio chagasii]CAH7048167.1 conserved hypothetical protein [Vibrio chagasii]CAH7249806.1 conserved hypothetical protein [Vibrio chagasii]CAH7254300.1 conserved hypothetical protein [Vibrio chagasii]
MAEPAKDINSIYASYNLTQHQYIEMTENESYTQAKSKWLIFQSKQVRTTDNLVGKKQAGIETEAI